MNNKLLKSILCVLICVCLFSACGSETEKKETVSTGTNVSVYKVSKTGIKSTVSYSGTLSALENVSISSKIGAKALSVNAKEGDYVEAGTVLLKLDSTDLENAYKQAQAAYNNALANYNSVVNVGTIQATSQTNQALVAAQAAYDQAKANYDREKSLYDNASNVILAQQAYDNAKANYDRIKQLFDMGGASQVELEGAYTQLVSAEQNLLTVKTTESAALNAATIALNNAEAALETAKQNVGLTETSNDSAIASASAGLASAKTNLDIALSNLSNAVITAPISGYVSKCNVSAGQLVSPGVEIFAITNTDMVNAEIDVTEAVISYLKLGGDAIVDVAGGQVNNYKGVITGLNPVKDQMTGLYNVKVGIDNPEDILKVGMLCDVTLTLSELTDIIKVPSEALITSGDEYFVYVAKGNKSEKRRVVIGISDEKFTEIIDGLTDGEQVVVSGKDYLSEKNNEINVTEEYK